MIVSLNGDKIEVKDNSTLASILGDRCFANRSGTAVSLNNVVVYKKQWSSTLLADKDRILVIAINKCI